MEVKESTLSAYQNHPTEEPKLTEPTAQSEVPVTTEVPIVAAAEQTAAVTPATDIPATEEVEFAMPSFEEAAANGQPASAQPSQTDWKEALKTNREEALKELGLDPFVIELNEHIKRGGQAADYLTAKAIDYNKMPDKDILLDDLKAKYPTLAPEKIQRIFDSRYKVNDIDDEVKEIGLIEMEADAAIARQQHITRQQSFKLPEPQVQAAPSQAISPEVKEAQERQQQFVSTILNSDTTKNLFQSKVVAINTGDGRTVNVKFSNPQQLIDVLFDPKVASKIGRTQQGEPDVQFWLETAAFMANRDHYKKMLVGSPKELAKKELVEEGRNAHRPAQVATANVNQYANYGEAFNSGSIRETKLGSYRQ